MANGRALPSALLFDWLLGRAWNMAMSSYANALRFSGNNLEANPSKPDVDDGSAGAERFLSQYHSNEAAAAVAANDASLRGQMERVAAEWATQFNAVLGYTVPVGPGFRLAVQWLRGVVNGADGLGYLGQDRRLAQARGYVDTGVNPYGLPLPSGAQAALQSVAARTARVYVDRLGAQMTAAHAAERHKLRIDAAEALMNAYNAALDATMDHLFTQMHLMFDVFGRNNDYLVRLQREEGTIRDRMRVRTAELMDWDQRIRTTDDSQAGSIRRIAGDVQRQNTIAQMHAEANIKLLRRFSSRAAAALNSAGVSVSSTASESNNIDAGA